MHLTEDEQKRWPAIAAMAAYHDDPVTRSIGEFIEWLKGESGYTLGGWVEENEYGRQLIEPRLVPAYPEIERLICAYHDVDYDVYIRERDERGRVLLDAIRAAQLQAETGAAIERQREGSM